MASYFYSLLIERSMSTVTVTLIEYNHYLLFINDRTYLIFMFFNLCSELIPNVQNLIKLNPE